MQLNYDLIDKIIREALHEDIGDGDHTSLSTIPADATGKAKLLVKENGIVAGVELAQRIFALYDPSLQVEVFIEDGSPIKKGDIVLTVAGSSQSILATERLMLNFMQRMSGIATKARFLADKIGHTKCRLLDTRKTTPNIRYMEKWAVRIGGAYNHRYALYDMIMIKDNHVDASGGIRPAIERVHAYLKENNLQLGITVEVRNLVEVHEVLEIGGITRIMFDNFEIPILMEAVATVNKRFETEASGGVTLYNIRKYAQTGVDYISTGALTHSAQPLDLSLKVIK